MLRVLALVHFVAFTLSCGAQVPVRPAEPEFPELEVRASLDRYREPTITTRRFKQEDLQPLIDALSPGFTVDVPGRSVEDRPLWRVSWGEGPTTVLLWSQMHGDEPTATAALFDLFNWLRGSGDGLDTLRQMFATQLQLTFLPMLNPDGAARFDRRNALGIDLNRDALHLTSPEAQLLKNERDRLDADWGFNLHDQGIYYSAGFPAEKGCVLSILAPAYDWEKSMNDKREDATQVIALMNALWQKDVPDQVGRYNDDFEPRAFGDNLQKWGTRTILIESGGYPGDPEKQEIRRLNLLGLIAGLHGIATGSYETHSVGEYWEIPENQSNGMHELILENVGIERGGKRYVMDVGMRRSETPVGPDNREFTSRAYISDLGDLHTFGAFNRLDLAGKRVEVGKEYPGELTSKHITTLSPGELYAQGYTAVRSAAPLPHHPSADRLRLLSGRERLSGSIFIGGATDLLVYDEAGQLEFVVANGRVVFID
ncbi:hypothetical protein GGR28_000558 [Lewinella aquimaris]|uniref:Peptidase M14 domain-containing protein n=2 Tax=Neolewinella aquimaris TaxID=1835722 RepID=A0A840E4C9_9BACT|nr:hypothetical protein [Neolewinella aquimaris]